MLGCRIVLADLAFLIGDLLKVWRPAGLSVLFCSYVANRSGVMFEIATD